MLKIVSKKIYNSITWLSCNIVINRLSEKKFQVCEMTEAFKKVESTLKKAIKMLKIKRLAIISQGK